MAKTVNDLKEGQRLAMGRKLTDIARKISKLRNSQEVHLSKETISRREFMGVLGRVFSQID